MSQQKPPIRFKNQVDSVAINPGDNDEEQQQQQQVPADLSSPHASPRELDSAQFDPPPSPHAARRELDSAQFNFPRDDDGELLLPHFKDQTRHVSPPPPKKRDPVPHDAFVQAHSLTVNPPIVEAVPIPDSQDQQQHASSSQENSDLPEESDSRSFKMKQSILWLIVVVVVVAVGVTVGITRLGGGGSDPSPTTSITPAPTSSPSRRQPTSPQPTSGPTRQLTSAPTVDPIRAAAVTIFVNSITLSNQTLQYPAVGTWSPEEEALAWLIEDDPLKLNESTDAERIRQRYALLTLWFHQPLSTQNGLEDWLTNVNECKWEGIGCTASVVDVDYLDLRDNNLEGRIPDDIGLLTALTWLSLRSNALTGTIPSSVSQLKALQRLHLWSNALRGTVPSSLGQLTDLLALDLSFNMLTGSIPSWIGQLKVMDSFSVSDNPLLSGTIPSEISNWSNLRSASFHNTNLTGGMPVCSLDKSFSVLVADCTEVNCTCCTACCPSAFNGIPAHSAC